MGELANCPNCGRVFVKGSRNLCKACYEKEEERFHTVYQYISKQENRRATLVEISKETGVKEKTITRFLKEGRLRLADFPNLGYPCESCGTPIREGKLCENCQTKLRVGLELLEKEEEVQRRFGEQRRAKTYYTKEPPSKD
ncbi:MAG TPA: TIGR03826 family flagellar region protein [Bacillales bacterium]|nr:TIGR03826 family flagellar region protein [Bacillales bacterium]